MRIHKTCSSFQLQVQAYDGGFPTLRDTTFVDINVIRVTEVLSFFTPSYTETISENQAIASNVITVTAQPAVSIMIIYHI